MLSLPMSLKFLILLLLLSIAAALDGNTHRALAGELQQYLDCDDSIINGSTDPDLVFHDTVRHHYYDTNWDCPEGNWTLELRRKC